MAYRMAYCRFVFGFAQKLNFPLRAIVNINSKDACVITPIM
jgi:hypothetical protein